MAPRVLLACALASTALADFFSDWANGPCPSPFPAHSYYCSSYTQIASDGTRTTFHRHKCYSVTGTDNHYCGDECDEICTVLQGGGATDAVCPGLCNTAHGTCKAEGSPVSAHCYCNAGWSGVHCTIGSSTPPPSPAPLPSPSPVTTPPPSPSPSPVPAPAPAPTTDYCQKDDFSGAALATPQNCGHGTCKNGASSYSCTCDSGWSGSYCLTSASTTNPAAGTWERAILDKHNEVRANIKSATHSEEPNAHTQKLLKWDYDLAENARKWVQTGKTGVFTCSALVHSPSTYRKNKSGFTNIGENLWAAGSTSTTPQDPVTAVTSWVSEYSDYDLASNSCASGKQCGHYTQVVWANTQTVGCALTTVACAGGFTWTVVGCQYGEAGNYVGQQPYVAVADGTNTVVA